MNFFLNFKRNLEHIDYMWTKPQTYLVFVPGLSLIIQDIQLSCTLPLIKKVTSQNVDQANAKARKFSQICKWHLGGSIVQLSASIIAVKTFAVLFFSITYLLASYELINTVLICLKNSIVYYEFDRYGNPKKIAHKSAFGVF